MPPVYATAPVLARLKDATGNEIPFRGTSEIRGIQVETGRNGHAPGGVWLRLSVGQGFLYMGDHSTESALYDFDLPPPTRTMVIDASYGEAEESLDHQRELLRAIVSRGPALLPAPPDGRAVEIAMFLQESGFDVAIDEEVRSVAKMMTGVARQSARADAIPRLDRLIGHARKLAPEAEARGTMVAHGASGDMGVAGALIKKWEYANEPAIVFTGHLPSDSTGKRLLDGGRARFQRWNVHPRFSDNLALIERIAPERIVPAFCSAAQLKNWPARIAPRKLVSSTPLEL
jgi:Cft2 family RNA processing exonuclease